MGDIWLPGLPPLYENFHTCYDHIRRYVDTDREATILAAIPGCESSYDAHVINDTPATGDYSVGLWQINYYDGLYDERTKAYGTPRQLATGGVMLQSFAAQDIYHQQGFLAWSTTYTSGCYLKYIPSGFKGGPGQRYGGHVPPPPTEIPANDWSGHIRGRAAADYRSATLLSRYAKAIARL